MVTMQSKEEEVTISLVKQLHNVASYRHLTILPGRKPAMYLRQTIVCVESFCEKLRFFCTPIFDRSYSQIFVWSEAASVQNIVHIYYIHLNLQ